jgi:hypothetical protein
MQQQRRHELENKNDFFRSNPSIDRDTRIEPTPPGLSRFRGELSTLGALWNKKIFYVLLCMYIEQLLSTTTPSL